MLCTSIALLHDIIVWAGVCDTCYKHPAALIVPHPILVYVLRSVCVGGGGVMGLFPSYTE